MTQAITPPDWGLNQRKEQYLGFLLALGQPIALANVRPGDVLTWRYGRPFSHAGILLATTSEILHAVHLVGVARARVDEEAFRQRPVRAFMLFEAA